MAADTAEQAPDTAAPPADPATPSVWSLTVDQAMVMVMREIGAVGKNGTNKEFGYKFRQQEDLVAAVRGPMAKYGLRLLPRVIEQKHFQRGKSNVAILTIEYIVRGPSGDVMEPSIIVVGEGADVSDKGTNKAMTAAKKYALVQAFEIAEANVDEGDQTSPDTEASPLDWYVNQLRREDVWYNRDALGRLRQRVLQYGHGDLAMPDDTGLTLLQTIEERGHVLLQKQQETDERRAGEREARDAQMRAEHPEFHSSSPDDELWQQQPSGQRQQPAAAAQASGPAPELPNPVDVEQRLNAAMEDPANAVKRLNEIRKHYTPAALKKVPVQTKWGQVDGNSAITFALKEVAQRGQQNQQSGPATPPPPPPAEQQRAPEPEPGPGHGAAEAPQAAAQPVPEPQDEPQAPARPEPEPQAPAPPPQPAQPARQRKAAGTKTERARYLLEVEAEFQAQMLGVMTLEYAADLLPANASSLEDIPGNVRLQSFIVENRPAVIAALIKAGMHRQAEEYTALGQRAPARNIEAIIQNALRGQPSF
jgi:hypothetical protein